MNDNTTSQPVQAKLIELHLGMKWQCQNFFVFMTSNFTLSSLILFHYNVFYYRVFYFNQILFIIKLL